MRMHFFMLPIAAILPTLPTVSSPAELMHGAIDFFSTWIARIGGVVALIGMIKFALSVKNEDSRESLSAILTAIAGFIIMEYVTTTFSFSTTTADTEFQNIMVFAMRWIRRVGSLALLLGAVTFGLSIKDNNAVNKVNGMKTIAAGGIVIATSAIWRLFF